MPFCDFETLQRNFFVSHTDGCEISDKSTAVFLIRPTSRQKHSCALWSKCSLTPDLCFSHRRIRSFFMPHVSLLWASRDRDSAVDALISKESLRLYFKGSTALVSCTEPDSLLSRMRREKKHSQGCSSFSPAVPSVKTSAKQCVHMDT